MLKPRPDPVEAIGWLRRAADKLAASGDADLARLGAAIGRYDAGRGGTTLDAECGVDCTTGAGPWWRREHRERRNAVLRQLRAECFPAMDVGEVAAEIIAEASRKTFDAAKPATRRGALLKAVLQTGPLPKRRQLKAILACNPLGGADCREDIPT